MSGDVISKSLIQYVVDKVLGSSLGLRDSHIIVQSTN